jgi:two-component system LytT family response regulator
VLTPPELRQPIRVLIVDDEAPARVRLRRFLQLERDFHLAGECSQGAQAVEMIRRERPDVVFLDVQMPRLDGFGVCQAIGPDRMPIVVFVTAYDQYALQAFDVCAIDYLLKPFDRARFQRTLERLRQRRAQPEPVAHRAGLQALIEELRAVPGPGRGDRLALRTDGKLIFVRFDEIDRVEADGNYVRFHTGPIAHLVRETLAWCEEQLPSDRFLRISRSILVNLDRVKEVQPLFYGDHVVILRDGTQLTLSRTYRDRLNALMPRGGPAGPAASCRR